MVSCPAGIDPRAPGGALALIVFLRAAVAVADRGIGPIAAAYHRPGALVEFYRSQPVGASLGALGLSEGRRGGEQREQDGCTDHRYALEGYGLRPAEPQRACVVPRGPICAPPMSTPRKTLSLSRVVAPAEGPALSADAQLIAQAVRRKLCIVAVYNRTQMTIAPHILYTKHDDLFIDGVVTLRDGKVPAEPKLGNFKLAGLNSLSLTAESFVVQPLYNPADAKYEGVTVAKVD